MKRSGGILEVDFHHINKQYTFIYKVNTTKLDNNNKNYEQIKIK